jgi:hypothetical protein
VQPRQQRGGAPGPVLSIDTRLPNPAGTLHAVPDGRREADPDALRRHGRLPDARWAELWDARLRLTTRRITALLAGEAERSVAADHTHALPQKLVA